MGHDCTLGSQSGRREADPTNNIVVGIYGFARGFTRFRAPRHATTYLPCPVDTGRPQLSKIASSIISAIPCLDESGFQKI